ncbi:MAG: Lrp/AsnC family transcriptional regulator [Candidatus Bathyarchaeia archaeon]
MDAVDTQILTELMKDAQMPFSHIAKKIGVSPETVRKRYEQMKKERIIKQCAVLVDGRKLGDEGTAFLMLSCAAEVDRANVMKSLTQIPDLYMIVPLIGDYDFFAWARFRNLQQLSYIIGDIRRLGNIDRIDTILLTQTYFTFTLAPEIVVKCDYADLPTRHRL